MWSKKVNILFHSQKKLQQGIPFRTIPVIRETCWSTEHHGVMFVLRATVPQKPNNPTVSLGAFGSGKYIVTPYSTLFDVGNRMPWKGNERFRRFLFRNYKGRTKQRKGAHARFEPGTLKPLQKFGFLSRQLAWFHTSTTVTHRWHHFTKVVVWNPRVTNRFSLAALLTLGLTPTPHL